MGEHLPCKQGVKGSNPFISTQDNILKCTLKTASRTNIYASIAFNNQLLRDIQLDMKQHRAFFFYVIEKEQNNVLKQFNADTLVSIKQIREPIIRDYL